MRILFLHRDLPPDSYTGVAIQVHRLANALSEAGHEVAVVTRSVRPADARYRVLPADGPWLRLALRLAPFLKRIWYPLWYRNVDVIGYDAVHVHGDGGFLAYRGPFVRTFYGTAGLELRHARTLKGRAAQALSWWMERREARRCAVCAGISPHIAGYLPGNIRTVPCMLPAEPDPAPSTKTAHPSMLFLGSRFSRKRGELALDLHRRLRAAWPDLRLTYVGPPGEIAGLAGSPGTEGVEFRSRLRQEELMALYRANWIYLCLSSYEGFGVGLIEAMACSCAVFTTPHPGSDYLVEDGVTAVVAPPEAAEAALGRLLADGAFRSALAGRAREHARRFAPAAVAREYLGLYGEAIATARPSFHSAGIEAVAGESA